MSNCAPCGAVFVVIFFKTMHNKTIIRFDFCEFRNNKGLGKCYQPQPSARLITLTRPSLFRIPQKTSPNNCLKFLRVDSAKGGRSFCFSEFLT